MYSVNKKFRKTDVRRPFWDYSWVGKYFITICTRDRVPIFGYVSEGLMNKSQIGQIVEDEWLKTPIIRPDMNITLGPYVVMPNHFHGIITINQNQHNIPGRRVKVLLDPSNNGSIQPPNIRNHFGNQSKNIPAIIGGFKSTVTSQAKRIDIFFKWQRRYHDHIIKSPDEYERIERYINNNPTNWKADRFYNNSKITIQ